MPAEPVDGERNRTSDAVRAIVVALGAFALLLLTCWIVVSLAAWRLAETWQPGD